MNFLLSVTLILATVAIFGQGVVAKDYPIDAPCYQDCKRTCFMPERECHRRCSKDCTIWDNRNAVPGHMDEKELNRCTNECTDTCEAHKPVHWPNGDNCWPQCFKQCAAIAFGDKSRDGPTNLLPETGCALSCKRHCMLTRGGRIAHTCESACEAGCHIGCH